jgi:hypothetical protein
MDIDESHIAGSTKHARDIIGDRGGSGMKPFRKSPKRNTMNSKEKKEQASLKKDLKG